MTDTPKRIMSKPRYRDLIRMSQNEAIPRRYRGQLERAAQAILDLHNEVIALRNAAHQHRQYLKRQAANPSRRVYAAMRDSQAVAEAFEPLDPPP